MKGYLRNTLCISAAFLLAMQLTGCATRQVALQYNSSMSPAVASGSPTVVIADFKDTRDDRSLGCVRNGYGMKLADVAAKPGEPSVPMWISSALVDELKRAGCLVVPENPGNAARFTISGEIQRVFVESYLKLRGEISIALCIKSGDQTVLNQLYSAEASKMNWWGSSAEFQTTLDMTLQELTKKMVPDLVRAMSAKYEDLPTTAENLNSMTVSAPSITTPVAAEPVSVAEVIQAKPAQPLTAIKPKTAIDVATQLKKLKELKDIGLVTEAEYEAKRKELVGEL